LNVTFVVGGLASTVLSLSGCMFGKVFAIKVKPIEVRDTKLKQQ